MQHQSQSFSFLNLVLLLFFSLLKFSHSLPLIVIPAPLLARFRKPGWSILLVTKELIRTTKKVRTLSHKKDTIFVFIKTINLPKNVCSAFILNVQRPHFVTTNTKTMDSVHQFHFPCRHSLYDAHILSSVCKHFLKEKSHLLQIYCM